MSDTVRKYLLFIITILLCSQVMVATSLPAGCLRLTSELIARIEESNNLVERINKVKTIVVAHGKNHNKHPESSWQNLIDSMENMQGVPAALEMDARITADGDFLINHDPTFHRVTRGYQTPQWKIDRFYQEKADLAGSKTNQWDFNLFDDISSFKLEEILSSLSISHHQNNTSYSFVSLREVIVNFRRLNQQNFLGRPLFFYVDLKDPNNYARWLYHLSDWYWVRTAWGEEGLKNFTDWVMRQLSTLLSQTDAYQEVMIPIRHPQIAKMLRAIDPKIHFMAAPDIIGKEASSQELIDAVAEYLPLNPSMMEVRYLHHVLDPAVREFASRHHLKILYNQIIQTDPSQFTGKYLNNLPLLLEDILAFGDNIIIQTNTVQEVTQFLIER